MHIRDAKNVRSLYAPCLCQQGLALKGRLALRVCIVWNTVLVASFGRLSRRRRKEVVLSGEVLLRFFTECS